MNQSIFVIGADNQLDEVSPSAFSLEADFQKLLADHPSLLRLAAGGDGDLLLVEQEFGIADQEGGSDRWRLDHLFLNREGEPVLIEVKRASDTRARREVVAQMLDYAAHAPKVLKAEAIAKRFRVDGDGIDVDGDGIDQGIDTRLLDFIGDRDPEEFWKQVDANLSAGRLRMVIVADKVGPELARIVEFLNEQMRPARMLAVELALFASPTGIRTLVPRLIGATSRAEAVKSVSANGSGGAGLNYAGTAKLAEVLQLCAERGDKIVVGFVGGSAKLRATSLADLQARRLFKWDNVANGVGTKASENWVQGSQFLKDVEAKK